MRVSNDEPKKKVKYIYVKDGAGDDGDENMERIQHTHTCEVAKFILRRPKEKYYVKTSCAPYSFPYYLLLFILFGFVDGDGVGDDRLFEDGERCAVKRLRCDKRKRQRELCKNRKG